MNNGPWTLVDGHVHMHRAFDPSRLLDAAATNLDAAAKRLGASKDWSGALLLAETQGVDWFASTLGELRSDRSPVPDWRLQECDEPITIMARRGADTPPLFIIAGRQIVTAERIEVLALMTSASISDGMTLDATLDACRIAGAVVVLPWGVGKWLGRRGRLVEQVLNTQHQTVLAGDNGGRPWFWPRPRVFARLESAGSIVLPGTDPLPIPAQFACVGRFGLALPGKLAPNSPAAALRSRLLTKQGTQTDTARAFGRLESASSFILNQVRMRTNQDGVRAA